MKCNYKDEKNEKKHLDTTIKVLSIIGGFLSIPITVLSIINSCNINKIQNAQTRIVLNKDISECRANVKLKIDNTTKQSDELVLEAYRCLSSYTSGSLKNSCKSNLFQLKRDNKIAYENLKDFLEKDKHASCGQGSVVLIDKMIESFDYLAPFEKSNFDPNNDLDLAGSNIVRFDDMLVFNIKRSNIQNLCCNYLNE